jgi:hypothetical protein
LGIFSAHHQEFSTVHSALVSFIQDLMTVSKQSQDGTAFHPMSKSLAYMSLVRPILEYGATCWDQNREGQIIALDRVQKKAAKFAHHTKSSNWETLASRRTLSRICSLFKAYSGERAWKAISDRLQRPHYLSRVNHVWKIRSRRQRTEIFLCE